MKEFIKNKLVELYKNVTTDQYGQVQQNKLTPSIFGDKEDEVEQFCKDNKGILMFSTYGWRYGTYKAFSVEDAEIKKACNDALKTNKNYLTNINSY
jgi:hypothetical protein